jgi:hypothetical protein
MAIPACTMKPMALNDTALRTAVEPYGTPPFMRTSTSMLPRVRDAGAQDNVLQPTQDTEVQVEAH